MTSESVHQLFENMTEEDWEMAHEQPPGQLSGPDEDSSHLAVRIAFCNGHGGFDLTQRAWDRYWELYKESGRPYHEENCQTENESESLCIWKDKKREGCWDFDTYNIARDDPLLLQVIDELELDACQRFDDIRIAMLNPLFKKGWRIDEYDGSETVVPDIEKMVRNYLAAGLEDAEFISRLKMAIELIDTEQFMMREICIDPSKEYSETR